MISNILGESGRVETKVEMVKLNGSPFTELETLKYCWFGNEIINDGSYETLKRKFLNLFSEKDFNYFNAGDQEYIDQIIDKANASQQSEYYIYPVIRVEDPRMLIRSGLFPTSMKIDEKWFTEWLNGMDIESIDFWWESYDVSIVTFLTNLTSEIRWGYYSIDYWRKRALSKADSKGLILFEPNSVYHHSKRPINNMSMYRTPRSFNIKRKDIKDNSVIINGYSWNIFPVTRYSSGMSRGLYYEEQDTSPVEFCGTFYYHEIESSTYLAFNTYHRSFNKFTAMQELLAMLEERDHSFIHRIKTTGGLTEEEKEYSNFYKELQEGKYDSIEKYVNGVYPIDLLLTPLEASRTIEIEKIKAVAEVKARKLPQNKYYGPRFLMLYAVEDEFDQPLCRLCKRLDIDVLILVNMPGSFSVVGEVLDSRDRVDSFKSLLYIEID